MAKMADYQYILMKDVYGEKAPGKIMSVLGGPKPVQVLRGELLAKIPSRDRESSVRARNDGRPPHNFRSTKDPSVTLYGGEDDEYVSPLNGRDVQLLEAIEKPYDQFAVLSEDNKLEWGSRLKRGDQVHVRLPGDTTPAPTWSAGVVRHAGPVGSLPGRNFGVEITVSAYVCYALLTLQISSVYRILVTLEKASVMISLGDIDILTVIKTVVSLCLWISLLLNHLTKCPMAPHVRIQRALLKQGSTLLPKGHLSISPLHVCSRSTIVWWSTTGRKNPWVELFAGLAGIYRPEQWTPTT